MVGCKKNTVKKLFKAWTDLNKKGLIGECMFFTDDEFRTIIIHAEEQFNLTEKEQEHELFWVDGKRLLSDLIGEI